MSNVYLHLDPSLREQKILAPSEEDGKLDIDIHNEDTFGSGAVEEDWECDHNQLVQLDFPKLDIKAQKKPVPNGHGKDMDAFTFGPLLSPSQLNDEDIELSNQQLAAAVEELVLNSDLDQDSIDPAIVSLRKQSLPSPSAIPGTSQHMAFPGLPQRFSNPNVTALFGNPPTLFDSDKMHHIWNETFQQNSQQAFQQQQHLQKLFPQAHNSNDQMKFSQVNSPDHSRANVSTPIILKAEDLEREMQASPPRVPSPLFGVSIPKRENGDFEDMQDRSLPARSISPVFGSPKPNYMPIGTPPKHMIMDMMHQLEQKSKDPTSPGSSPHLFGGSGQLQRPPPPPGIPPHQLPFFLQAPPPTGARLPGHMPLGVPPGAIRMMPPRAGMPFLSPDIMHRLGLRPQHPAVHSPIGSPRHFPSPPAHILGHGPTGPPVRMPPAGLIRPGMHRPIVGFGHNRPRMPGMDHPMRLGPGHLHPEHSKYVRLREQRRGRMDRRGYNNQQRMRPREGMIGVPGDPYANIMSQKEKDWVIKIQMMALQSDRPEIDDYYYQNYIEHRLQDGKLNLDDSGKVTKRLITPTKPNLDNRKYVPVQFTNSLGKLTASSVYNPRQIIDIAPSQEEETANQETPESRQTLSKRLVIYKTIEKAYVLVISLEEIGFQLLAFNEMDDAERELLELEIKSKTETLEEVLGFNDNSRFRVHDDPVFQVVKIRKGKKLITRAMNFLKQDHAILVVQSVFSHLAILIKRDSRDGVLHEMYAPISRILSSLDFNQIVSLCSMLSTFTLTAAVRDQFGVSLICKLLYCGKQQQGFDVSEKNEQWLKFVNGVSEVMLSVTNPKGTRQVRPNIPSPLLEDFPIDVFEILATDSSPTTPSDKLRTSFDQLIANKDNTGLEGVTQLEAELNRRP
uniref:Protein PAT1 homolog 1 n=1 Tax=Phallusia mammillata TaxID=59560 RepID=A0A6F9DMJ6_9ASCI|nr:protein PAT1 homolog 1 [Phallusia mammillata]